VKFAGFKNGAFTLALLRNVIGLGVAIIAALLNKKRNSPIYGQKKNLKWLLARAFFGALVTIGAFISVKVRIHKTEAEFRRMKMS